MPKRKNHLPLRCMKMITKQMPFLLIMTAQMKSVILILDWGTGILLAVSVSVASFSLMTRTYHHHYRWLHVFHPLLGASILHKTNIFASVLFDNKSPLKLKTKWFALVVVKRDKVQGYCRLRRGSWNIISNKPVHRFTEIIMQLK